MQRNINCFFASMRSVSVKPESSQEERRDFSRLYFLTGKKLKLPETEKKHHPEGTTAAIREGRRKKKRTPATSPQVFPREVRILFLEKTLSGYRDITFFCKGRERKNIRKSFRERQDFLKRPEFLPRERSG